MSEDASSQPQKWTPPPVGTPCWVEIPASDVQACKKFYAGVFPSWSFKPASKEYPDNTMALWEFAGSSGLTGGIVHVPEDCKSTKQTKGVGVTVYHFVESIEDTQKLVEGLGGESCSGKEPEGDNGWYMNFKDIAGNRFGVYQVKKK